METQSELQVFVGDTRRWPVDSPHKGSVIWIFDTLFSVSLNKLLNKDFNCRYCEVTTMINEVADSDT